MAKHQKFYPVNIWFLDDNLIKSAQYQTNKTLIKSITGCMNTLVSVRMYFIGIRSKKFYNYYFDKSRSKETIDKYFPGWPLKLKPAFTGYTSKESKWCRKCGEHYNYVQHYLDALLLEYSYRFGKTHGLQKFADWLVSDAPDLNIPDAGLKEIDLPWKVLNPRNRRPVIIDGYRLQFMKKFEKHFIDEYNNTKRDVPDFVTSHFKLDEY